MDNDVGTYPPTPTQAPTTGQVTHKDEKKGSPRFLINLHYFFYRTRVHATGQKIEIYYALGADALNKVWISTETLAMPGVVST